MATLPVQSLKSREDPNSWLHKQKDRKSATVCLNNYRSIDAATTYCSKWTAVTRHDPPLKCSPLIVPAHRLNHVASERFVCVIVSQGRV